MATCSLACGNILTAAWTSVAHRTANNGGRCENLSSFISLGPKGFNHFAPIIEEEVFVLIEEISNYSDNEVINLSSMVMNLASAVICRMAFGKKYDERDHDKKRRTNQILIECQAMFAVFFVSDYLRPLRWIDKLSGMLARLERNFSDLDSFYQELIEDHMNPNRPDSMKDDVLDLMIQIKDKQLLSFNFSWDRINLFNFSFWYQI
ncbi:OLC1v1029617C1 [Oldenlandia corymbosa var. corymbosa]|uniref:OLC1v1029617C1 n=1 Tax=Oldenlandia corymbosa var. corymbosa TaxID=529605 RepID=A0AAV1CEI9_OLDCO|nr:OLC1v1029617C1 [Oldenlandia corymbosa var. corymbosa]